MNLTDQINRFEEAILSELAKAMALQPTARIIAFLRSLVGKGTLGFSKLMVECDQLIAKRGSWEAARWLMPRFAREFSASGQEIIPETGPLLVVSNHPAAFDSILLSAYINRPDYKVIIGDVPPFHFLPNLCQHAIFSPENNQTYGRMQTVRSSIRHLAGGGALLIFPRGGIEPDPSFMPEPDVEFPRWSHSLDIFLRHVPDSSVLVCMVSGVIARAAMQHPITWLRKLRPDRQRLAFMYQFLRQLLGRDEHFGLQSRVTFGELLSGENHIKTLAEVEQAARRTLDRHMRMFHPSLGAETSAAKP